MGAVFAVLSMTFFATSNIAVIRGFDGKTRSGGAFVSIVITFALSFAIWFLASLHNGWSPITGAAVAWFAFAGILTIFLGRVFLYASIQHLGAVKASAIKRLNPFFSVLLGVVLLGESLSTEVLTGMALICASFYVLVRPALRSEAAQEHGPDGLSGLQRLKNLGFLYGPVSALAYASGYVARKQGLLILPDAAFGTMLGALTGIVVFFASAQFVRSYREDIQQTFKGVNPWLLLAGFLSSLGQLCYFVALNHSSISKIALITSMEVFVTMFFSIVVFRSRERLAREVVVAGVLGVAGTALVILD